MPGQPNTLSVRSLCKLITCDQSQVIFNYTVTYCHLSMCRCATVARYCPLMIASRENVQCAKSKTSTSNSDSRTRVHRIKLLCKETKQQTPTFIPSLAPQPGPHPSLATKILLTYHIAPPPQWQVPTPKARPTKPNTCTRSTRKSHRISHLPATRCASPSSRLILANRLT